MRQIKFEAIVNWHKNQFYSTEFPYGEGLLKLQAGRVAFELNGPPVCLAELEF